MRHIDFTPGQTNAKHIPIRRAPTEEELRRREIAKKELARREEIQKQIERQNEEEILAKRRADAARRELARQRAVEEESERARAEKEAEREEAMLRERQKRAQHEKLERAAALERKRILEARRIEAAKRELARREEESAMKRARVKVDDASGSVDPLAKNVIVHASSKQTITVQKTTAAKPHPAAPARPATSPTHSVTPNPAMQPAREVSVKTDGSSRRVFGRIPAAEKVVTQAEKDYQALHPESLGDIDNFEKEVDEIIAEFDEYDVEFDEVEDGTAATFAAQPKQEDASKNNYSYVLGGRSPFINTDRVEKRPLSGDYAPAPAREAYASRSHDSELDRKGYGPSRPSTTRTSRPASRISASRPLLGGPEPNSYVSPADYPSSRYVPYEEPIPHKNLYARRLEEEKKTSKNEDLPTMVVANPDKGSGLALAAVILVTIILGAAVGVIAYLAFFQ